MLVLSYLHKTPHSFSSCFLYFLNFQRIEVTTVQLKNVLRKHVYYRMQCVLFLSYHGDLSVARCSDVIY